MKGHMFFTTIFALFFLTFISAEKSSADGLKADPQSLVGKWESEVDGEGWKTNYMGRESKGDLYIQIEKVEGDKAYGKIYIEGRQNYHNQWHKFTAAVSEINDRIVLDFTLAGFMVIHLEARGDKMTGTGLATATANFSLKKLVSRDK